MFDTDVLIWYFRGNKNAEKYLHNTKEISLSAVTVMEILQDIRNKQELRTIHKFLRANNIRIYYLNEEINIHGMHLLEEYTLSDGVEWGDALIAATALYYDEKIFTANIKHYQCFPNLNVKKFDPL